MSKPTPDEIDTVDDALDYLGEMSGQSYIQADDAHRVMQAFDYEFPADDVWVAKEVYSISEMAHDARGMLNVQPYVPVTTIDDLSAHLCELLGLEPGESGAVGAGFAADGRHTGSMVTLRKWWDDE